MISIPLWIFEAKKHKKLIHNVNGAHRKNQVIQRIILKKNSSNFVHQQNIFHMRHIEIVDKYPALIHVLKMEMSQLIIVVTLIVVYYQYPQIIYLNLKIFSI